MIVLIKKYYYVLIFFSLLLSITESVFAAPPAFPGAEGFGASTAGGRGGRILEVNNLNDSGPGSLRAALEDSGPRIVVFKVGGTIKLIGQINIVNPYLTVAGQTAPGDGILIRGGVLNIGSHDVIIRGLRIRMGDEPSSYPPDQRDGIGIVNLYSGQDIYNVILDHNSVSWGIDENVSIWSAPNLYNGKSFHDITIQWNIISEGLYCSIHPKGCHSMGLLVGDRSKRISVHHNLFAHNNQRNPLLKGDTQTEVINNLIYDWGGSPTSFSDLEARGPSTANIINNFYKIGPGTRSNHYGIYFSNMPTGTKVYVHGNIGPTRLSDTQPEWDIAASNPEFQSSSLTFPLSGITTHPAIQVTDTVLQKAGATIPKRDQVDQRIINDVINGTGSLIDSQTQIGGWPEIVGGPAPQDTDHDGMPDEFEILNGLNPTDKSDASSIASSGYTWIEEYINSLISITPYLTTTPNCPKKPRGDADCNDIIDTGDFTIWKSEYASAGQHADFDSSGKVSIFDLHYWIKGYLNLY